MDSSVLPLFLFAVVALALAAVMLLMGRFLGPRRQGDVKQMPYESGMDPLHDTHRRFDVRFHLVAIAFLIFDVELLFLYPWAVARTNPQGIELAVRKQAEEYVAIKTMPQRNADPYHYTVAFHQQQVDHEVRRRMILIFAEVMVFIILLAVGFAYAWRKGVFQWQ